MYVDNRWKPEITYKIKDNTLYLTWEVTSRYDFDPNPRYKTIIPIPKPLGGGKIEIPDRVLYYMARQGLAKEFTYYTKWTAKHKLS